MQEGWFIASIRVKGNCMNSLTNLSVHLWSILLQLVTSMLGMMHS
jgi:hypothetical protein